MKEYLKKYRSRFLLAGAAVFLVHGAKLNSNVVGIDTEDIIQYQNEFYGGWLNTGRQGLVFIKQLMGNLSFNPYLTGVLTLLCFTCAVVSFFMLWDGAWKKQSSLWAGAACGLLWISHPIMTEQFYFTLQSVEIGIGFFLTAVSLYLTRCWEQAISGCACKYLYKTLWMPAISVFLLLVTFSLYQIFVVIFIFGAISLILLQCLGTLLEDKTEIAKRLLVPVIPYVVVFLTAFVLNTVITNCFFRSSDYLSNQIQWGSGAVTDNFRYIAGHVVKTLTGYEGIYYNFGYGILCVMTVVAVIALLVRCKCQKSTCDVLLFYVAAIISTPYLMTLVIGGAPACRSQLVLPILTGFLAYLVTEVYGSLRECHWDKDEKTECVGRRKNVLTSILCCGIFAGCIIGVWIQTGTTMRLYYTDSMRYEQDAAIGREMIVRIEQLCAEEDVALVVVGSKPFEGNNACIEGEMMGTSFFAHDVEVDPPCYWSTKRVLGLLHVLGADYDIAPEDRFYSAIAFSKNMPAWPSEECVQEQDGIIVVKMSDYE